MPQPNTNESHSPDGARWVALDENSKYAYIVGFLQGMFLGHSFTTWGFQAAATIQLICTHRSLTMTTGTSLFPR